MENASWRFWYVRRVWTDVFLRPHICLRETKLQSSQYKGIHNIINSTTSCLIWKLKTPLYVHTASKQMIPVTFSSYVKMCMNSRERYVPGGIRLIMTGLTFQRIQMQKTIIFGSQDATEYLAVLNFCIFHIKHNIYRQRLFHDNGFQIHEIQNVIVEKVEI